NAAAGGHVRRGDRGAPAGLAHVAAAVAGRSARGRQAGGGDRRRGSPVSSKLRIGIVCPYSFAVPGGVQNHVADLAKALLARGHEVSVLAPAAADSELPHFVQQSGRAVGVPFNGAVARLQFGQVPHARARCGCREQYFVVWHMHRRVVPSLSRLALYAPDAPIVATFHMFTGKSLSMLGFRPVLRPWCEKITGRIAVSELA